MIWVKTLQGSFLFILGLCGAIGMFAGLSANLFSILLPQVLSHLYEEMTFEKLSGLGGYIAASFLTGWMLGGIAIGIASDYLGRVKGMVFSIALYSIATFLVPFASTLWHLHVIRFVTGIGVGGAMVSCTVFLSESRLKMTRGVSLGILVGSYQAGVLLSGIVAGSLDWQRAFTIGIIPLLLALIVYMSFEEPFSNKTAKPLNNVRATLFDYKKQIIFGSILFGALLIGYWASLSWIPIWIESLLNHLGKEKATATILHGLMAVFGCLVAGFLSDRWGQRKVMIIAFLGAFLCSLKMFFSYHVFHPMIYMENGLLGFFIGMAQAVLYIYLPELFPPHIRGGSVALCLNIGRVVTIVALFFVGYLVVFFGGFAGALSVFAVFYLIGAITACFAPETRVCKSE